MKECLNCGKEHERVRYCSNKCASIASNKRFLKKLHTDEERLNKHRLHKRNEKRKKKGINVNLPPLLAPRGSGNTNSKGYRRIYVRGHPNSSQKGSSMGMIFEHVYVMSIHLGRPLFPGECVHHLNGVRNDNRIENLELWNRSQCPGQRVEEKIEFYKSFLEQYGYSVSKVQHTCNIYDKSIL